MPPRRCLHLRPRATRHAFSGRAGGERWRARFRRDGTAGASQCATNAHRGTAAYHQRTCLTH
eukprot:2174002-Heterocapsa_arctica.AAC.1